MDGPRVEQRADLVQRPHAPWYRRPSTVTSPAVGRVSPRIIRMVVVLPAPLRVLCHLTRENRQPCHPVGERTRTGSAVDTLVTAGFSFKLIASFGHPELCVLQPL